VDERNMGNDNAEITGRRHLPPHDLISHGPPHQTQVALNHFTLRVGICLSYLRRIACTFAAALRKRDRDWLA
jgi:hypothetical protein